MRTFVGFVVVLLLCSSCGVQVREARAVQPNPITTVRSKEDIPASLPLYVYQKDVQLGPDYQLRNSAQFVVVDKNRLRFRVSVMARDESEAEPAGNKVWLVDAAGRRYDPSDRENGHMTRVAVNVRPLPYRPAGNRCTPPPCFDILASGFEVYQGQSDYVFRADGLADSAQGFTLHVEHDGVELRFTWRFGDGAVVTHYGRTEADALHGIIEVPGPQTKVVATRAEGDNW
jgi:hypothetical protein